MFCASGRLVKLVSLLRKMAPLGQDTTDRGHLLRVCFVPYSGILSLGVHVCTCMYVSLSSPFEKFSTVREQVLLKVIRKKKYIRYASGSSARASGLNPYEC